MRDVQHVYPIYDTHPHVFEEWCPCRPRVEECGGVVVHNSWDGREAVEEAYRLLGWGEKGAGDGWMRETVGAGG